MLARELFGPAADQRCHDRIAEIQRERRLDALIAPAASVTWQASRPLTLREREDLHDVAVRLPHRHLDWDPPTGRKTMSTHITNILRALGIRKSAATVAQSVPDALPGAPASSEG